MPFALRESFRKNPNSKRVDAKARQVVSVIGHEQRTAASFNVEVAIGKLCGSSKLRDIKPGSSA